MKRWRSPAVAARVARAVPRPGEEPPKDESPCRSLAISPGSAACAPRAVAPPRPPRERRARRRVQNLARRAPVMRRSRRGGRVRPGRALLRRDTRTRQHAPRWTRGPRRTPHPSPPTAPEPADRTRARRPHPSPSPHSAPEPEPAHRTRARRPHLSPPTAPEPADRTRARARTTAPEPEPAHRTRARPPHPSPPTAPEPAHRTRARPPHPSPPTAPEPAHRTRARPPHPSPPPHLSPARTAPEPEPAHRTRARARTPHPSPSPPTAPEPAHRTRARGVPVGPPLVGGVSSSPTTLSASRCSASPTMPASSRRGSVSFRRFG